MLILIHRTSESNAWTKDLDSVDSPFLSEVMKLPAGFYGNIIIILRP